jgi:hypothetical protein
MRGDRFAIENDAILILEHDEARKIVDDFSTPHAFFS